MDAHAAQLCVERARDVEDEPLGRGVDGQARLRRERRHAGDVDDAGTAVHERQRAVHEFHGRLHEQLDHVRRVGGALEREVAERAEARVVDEQRDIGVLELGDGVFQYIERGRVGQVERKAAHGRGAGSLERLEPLGAAGDDPQLIDGPRLAGIDVFGELAAKP